MLYNLPTVCDYILNTEECERVVAYKLGQYSELFRREGYKWDKDFANMKALNVNQLKRIGVKKRGMWLLIWVSAGFLAAIQHSFGIHS